MVLFALLFSLYGNATKISADDPVITLEQHIQQIFGSKAKVALAVLKHESNLKLNSINYNCRYNGRSTFCKKGDEYKAWSVDCGIAQINTRGQICPKELLTLEGNMKALEKIYKEQGLNAFVSYKTGAYKKYL
jgi:hypothetical protein